MIQRRVTLPWAPTSKLSANSRLHWRPKATLIRAQKATATALAWEAGLHLMTVPEGIDLHIGLIICPPSRVTRVDDDNVITAQKGALDAIAAVLRVDDSRFRLQAPVRGERCKSGAVIVEISFPALVLPVLRVVS